MEKPVVLVIEDEDAIQGMLDDALREAGFETGMVRTGEEAVTLLRGGLVRYCALVTDINLLGRFNGWEVARVARQIDANFPIVYISGVRAAQWPQEGVPDSMLLQKPFAPAQLVTALSQLLNGGVSVGSDA